MILREYQVRAIERARAMIRSGNRRIILLLATGGGKTVIAAEIIKGAIARGNRVLFCAHRTELLSQASNKLDAIGLDHGVIKSGHWRQVPTLPVQVASVQTLVRRAEMPAADLVIIDECHRAAASSYKKIMSHYPNAISLGLTATAIRFDGKGLGDYYDSMLEVIDIQTLIAQGFLVEPITYAPATPDLDGVNTVAGDYNQRQLAAEMDKPRLVGDLVRTWQRLAAGRTTIAFGVSIAHSQHIAEEFQKAGIAAEHLDGETEETKRADILGRLADGRLTLVSNVNVLAEGFDDPATSCIILARPTQSVGMYLQMVGRGLRSHPGKRDAIILDHAGCCMSHGFATDPREYSLAGIARKPRDTPPGYRICAECYAVCRMGLKGCPHCTVAFPRVQRDTMPEHIEGELTLQKPGKIYLPLADDEKKRSKYQELVAFAASQGYSPKWPMMRFKILFGHWPEPHHKQTA